MATKTKKRTAKRRPARTKATRKAKSRTAKRQSARPKASKRSLTSKTKPARKATSAQVRPGAIRPASAGAAREAERRRLLEEERALERDVDNEDEPSALSESQEFIPGVSEDSLAEELGEAAVESATSGDQAAENIRDEDVSEELGGPFVITPARREFARGTDPSNPPDAEPAPFPTATTQPK